MLLGNIGGSLLVGAGLIGATTAIYYFVVRSKQTPPPVNASVGVGPGSGMFVVHGNF